MQKKCCDNARLLITDTDSLAYENITADLYKDFTPHIQEKFDNSNYPAGHSSGIPVGVSKIVISMFKDECSGKGMTKFVGFRPKLYSNKMDNGDTTKTAKGSRGM